MIRSEMKTFVRTKEGERERDEDKSGVEETMTIHA